MPDRAVLIRVLEESGGSLAKTARALGVTRGVLLGSLRRASIEHEGKRGRSKMTLPIELARDLHDRGISYRKIADILDVLGHRVTYATIRNRLKESR